jgi:hypothetical protein
MGVMVLGTDFSDAEAFQNAKTAISDMYRAVAHTNQLAQVYQVWMG